MVWLRDMLLVLTHRTRRGKALQTNPSPKRNASEEPATPLPTPELRTWNGGMLGFEALLRLCILGPSNLFYVCLAYITHVCGQMRSGKEN